MKLSEAKQVYDELVAGKYIGVSTLAAMEKTFRKAASRAKTAIIKDEMYCRYRDCQRLVDYCIDQDMPFASIDM